MIFSFLKKKRNKMIKKRNEIITVKTIHSRFHPVKHSFQYPLYYFGVWFYKDEKDQQQQEHSQQDAQEEYRQKDSSLDEKSLQRKPTPRTNINLIDPTVEETCIPNWLFKIRSNKHDENDHHFLSLDEILFRLKNISLFSLNLQEYLGDNDPQQSLYQRVVQFLQNQNETDFASKVHSIYLMTTPKFLNYSFNPLSVYFCYDGLDKYLGCILEVNNTFNEKHLYICYERQTGLNDRPKGFDHKYVLKRSFHVSPFNNRSGIYECYLKDPLSNHGEMDILLLIQKYKDTFNSSTQASMNDTADIMNSSCMLNTKENDHRPDNVAHEAHHDLPASKKHLMARVFGQSRPLNILNLLHLLIFYPINVFLTVPRIMYEAYLLAYKHKLHVYQRPNPYTDQDENTGITMQRKAMSSFDEQAFEIMVKFLYIQCQKHQVQVHIKLLHSCQQTKEIVIGSSNTNQTVHLLLHNTWLCKRLLFMPFETGQALSTTFVRKEWDCLDHDKELPLFLRLFCDSDDEFFEPIHLTTPHTFTIKKSNTTKPMKKDTMFGLKDGHHDSFPFSHSSFLSLKSIIRFSCYTNWIIWMHRWLVHMEEYWFTAITNFDLNPYTVSQRIVEYDLQSSSSFPNNSSTTTSSSLLSSKNLPHDVQLNSQQEKNARDIHTDDEMNMIMIEKQRYMVFKKAYHLVFKGLDKKKEE